MLSLSSVVSRLLRSGFLPLAFGFPRWLWQGCCCVIRCLCEFPCCRWFLTVGIGIWGRSYHPYYIFLKLVAQMLFILWKQSFWGMYLKSTEEQVPRAAATASWPAGAPSSSPQSVSSRDRKRPCVLRRAWRLCLPCQCRELSRTWAVSEILALTLICFLPFLALVTRVLAILELSKMYV